MTSEHIETWWWNEAVEEKGRCYKTWHKPKQEVIGISIRRQDEMREVLLLLHRKRQDKSLLVSWRVQI